MFDVIYKNLKTSLRLTDTNIVNLNILSIILFSSLIIQFFTYVIFLGSLEEKTFGEFIYYLSLVILTSGIVKLGIDPLIVRDVGELYLSKNNDFVKKISYYFQMNLIQILIFSVFFITFSFLILKANSYYSLILIILGILNITNTFFESILKSFQKIKLSGFINTIIRPLSFLGIFCIRYIFEKNISLSQIILMYILSLIISIILQLLITLNTIKTKSSLNKLININKIGLRDFQKLIPTSSISLSELFETQIPYIILGNYSRFFDITVFKIAEKILSCILIPYRSSCNAIIPIALDQNLSKKEMTHKGKKVTKHSTYLAILLFVTSLIFARLVIINFFGEEYIFAYYISLILGFSHIIGTLTGPSIQSLILFSKPFLALISYTPLMLSIYIFLFFLTPYINLIGFASGISLFIILTSFLAAHILKKYTGVNFSLI